MRASQRFLASFFWLSCLLISYSSALATYPLYQEDFSTTTYKDPVATTADWNTATGKLQLFPFQPTLLGSYDSPGTAYGVEISGTRAYVADGASGLRIVNIANQANPV